MSNTNTPRCDEWRDMDYQDLAELLEQELNTSKVEIERLKANLRRAIEIAEDFLPSGYDGYDETIRTELDQIKATLTPTDK